MKRCSQCDFIYEDDQHLCDMDGHELIYEPTLHSLQVNAISTSTTHSPSSGARRQALAATLAVLIATILSVGYAGFTRENSPQSTKAPSKNVIPEPQPEPDPIPPTPVVSPSPSPGDLEKTRVSPTNASPIARSQSSTDPGRESVRSRPTKANHKKESRIGGFLKKTGNLLKKPFKR